MDSDFPANVLNCVDIGRLLFVKELADYRRWTHFLCFGQYQRWYLLLHVIFWFCSGLPCLLPLWTLLQLWQWPSTHGILAFLHLYACGVVFALLQTALLWWESVRYWRKLAKLPSAATHAKVCFINIF
jgi:hypothetical protein